MKVIMCPQSCNHYIDLLKGGIESNNVDVEVIPWFGKQSPYTVSKMLLSNIVF